VRIILKCASNRVIYIEIYIDVYVFEVEEPV
jgi:hypothetical protein